MTLNFSSWILCPSGPTSIGYQYDNLTDVLQVTGTVPAGWSWDLMVQCGTNLNIIPMEQAEDGSLSVTLTAEMIPLTGYYTMQLRATKGELVKYTNQFQAYVGASLSGDAQWPTVPTEFTQVEQNILDLNQHPPYPGDEGYWMTWDLESGAYVQSQLPLPPVAEGPPGKAATIQVGTTTTGEPGTEATVQNVGNENAAILNFTIPAGAAGPTGATPAISVQVSGLPAGSEPTVSVSGTPEAPVISLGIPAGQQGTPGTPGTNGTDGQTPNITIGTVETLPAGSDVTASITGQTPNLVLNLGIPQGPAGAGVPSTEGVPTDYLLSPAGWVAPPSGGGENWELIIDHVAPETVASVLIDQDLNGEPFALKKWALLTIWLPDENISTNDRSRVGFVPEAYWGGNACLYETYSAPKNTEIAAPTLAFCSFTNGMMKVDDFYHSVNKGNMGYTLTRQVEDGNYGPSFEIDSASLELKRDGRDTYATCVKIVGISSATVRKGSVIRLWGVRA